jgi:hypothetical protein
LRKISKYLFLEKQQSTGIKVDEIVLIIAAVIMMTAGIIGAFITWREIKKGQKPKDTCILCKRTLKPEEFADNALNKKMLPNKKHICKNCMINNLEKQNNICPQCKQPLKWDDSLELFLNEWYHPDCAYIVKEVKLQKKR